MANRVYVTGGTGFVGKALCPILTASGYDVVTMTRQDNPRLMTPTKHWDHETPVKLENPEAVIHLAGEPIFGKRWSTKQKAKLYDSRIRSTRALVDSFSLPNSKPKVFVCASAIGYYGSGEKEMDETAPAGQDFLANICIDWEKEAQRAEALGVRAVNIRIGIVIGRKGGAVAKMLPPFKMGLGGPIGSGSQWMSWVHVEDVCGLIVFTLKHPELKGPVNATAPTPARNKVFSQTLGAVLRRPAFLPTPPLALKLLMGEAAGVLVVSQKIKPAKAQKAGYQFKYSDLEEALRDAVR